ncbi:MAG TPA: iron-containing redox enzyme family protein [Nocardia sp.]|uniref:iron-containing redox enzyme family protein n=1 Tax=Nocardia TaxID=1817 RepID=UPI0024590835|nr:MULTISPECIES: iron-containing redox enzyme family protein [Nocardia]HLS77064.1 iron-containing redox enzyme family protein [Nocardia sp.]
MTIAVASPPTRPTARGPLSEAVIELLGRSPGAAPPSLGPVDDPFGDDLQLALHTCYELHYQGYGEVDPGWEWDPGLLGLRAGMEQVFLDALRAAVPGGDRLEDELEALLVVPEKPSGTGAFLLEEGHWWQVREYFVHRSIYHHKEADPYVWVIPRLRGQAKASLVAVEFDEFGGGHGDRVHAQLYADLLAGAGLHPGYLHYLDDVGAPMLALVNMMSLFGLHRVHRGALVGHFASVEITSPPASERLVRILRRFDAAPACVRFYAEHVEADAVHEQVMRAGVIGDLLAREPDQRAAMTFGIQVTNFLEDRFADHVLSAWRAGRSSLREGAIDA